MNGVWGTETNKELDEVMNHSNIINYVKAQRSSWFGHTNRMSETSIVRKIYKWKPSTSRPVGRPVPIIRRRQERPEKDETYKIGRTSPGSP